MRNCLVYIILALLSGLISCEEQDYQNTNTFPQYTCESDWLTNPIYHEFSQNEPVEHDATSFTANINGENWMASKEIEIIYFDKGLTAIGEDEKHRLVFDINNIYDNNSFVDFYIRIEGIGNYHYETNYNDIEFEILNLDTKKRKVTAKFSAVIFLVSDYFTGDYVISNGKLNNLAFSRLYCKKNYPYKDIEASFLSQWNLIEIVDCKKEIIYLPPCKKNPSINFAPTDSFSNDEIYKNIFTAIGCPNKLYSSFKYLNDSIIVTSNGFQTLVGSRVHIIDYEKLYFDILREDTFKIKKYFNLLELINVKGQRLRFYLEEQ